MAVVIETTLGDITVDLFLEQRPVTCLNFLKLCKMKYYNFNLFHSIRSGFIAQTGDPTGEGSGGESIWGILEGPQKRFFSGEKMPKIRHTDAGLLSMVCSNDMMVGSQFFFTLAPDLDSLDGTHCVIGEVTEGQEVLSKLNEVICDETYRPYRDVRITHTVVLEDPFSDPVGFRAPSRSPSPSAERLKGGRIAPDEEIDETEGKSAAEIQEQIEEKEAKARATILEIVGDLPDADIAPPENVLFVCKLNPVTTDDDLEIIFCRFGKIISCEVIRDKSTGNSLQYAFIEFDDKKSCEDAYFKMDNVLIDDRRIHVDFAQSVSKMRWLGKGRGVQYLDDKNSEGKNRDRKDKGQERARFEGKEKPKEIYNDRRHEKQDKSNDRNEKVREKKYDNNRTNRNDNKRSRSRSRHNSRDRIKNGDHRKHGESYQSSKSDHRNNHTSRSHRPSRSPVRNDREKSTTSKYKKERDNDYETKNNKDYRSKHRDERNHLEKHIKSDEKKIDKKRNRHNMEPKTPSPIIDRKVKEMKKKSNSKEMKKEKQVKKSTTKRKRKESTSSSDSDSSDSSSSSSSSSSESDQRKKKVTKKKRKVSTSSSSSDSSNTSTSSSSSSSDTSSSSSDSEPQKKRSKKSNKKVKKSRNK